jgi:hypothetical protein
MRSIVVAAQGHSVLDEKGGFQISDWDFTTEDAEVRRG